MATAYFKVFPPNKAKTWVHGGNRSEIKRRAIGLQKTPHFFPKGTIVEFHWGRGRRVQLVLRF